jgi:short-subunit dehydrogenase
VTESGIETETAIEIETKDAKMSDLAMAKEAENVTLTELETEVIKIDLLIENAGPAAIVMSEMKGELKIKVIW